MASHNNGYNFFDYSSNISTPTYNYIIKKFNINNIIFITSDNEYNSEEVSFIIENDKNYMFCTVYSNDFEEYNYHHFNYETKSYLNTPFKIKPEKYKSSYFDFVVNSNNNNLKYAYSKYQMA
jgi:hypothetical protein